MPPARAAGPGAGPLPIPTVAVPLSLARKYRPRRFAELIAQEHVGTVLAGAVARGRVGHGYLLTGPRGVGKTTAARVLAMALNCPDREATGEPCGTCPSCTRIWSGGASLDVIEIDAASNRGVDDARDLRERAMYAASREGGHKVYIVDEAHMLTREAWNALLKILEEPPPRVVFVFATTEPQKIANTAAPVLSRLQRFDFHRIATGAIRDRLRAVLAAEAVPAEDDALVLIARHADGGMRDALSVLDQCLSFGEGPLTAERVRETLGIVGEGPYAELLDAIAAREPARIFGLVERLLQSGADPGEFVNGAAELLRALLMLRVGATPPDLTDATRELLARHREALAPGDLLRMLRLLADAEPGIRRGGNPRLAVETLLLRWTMMDRTVDLEAVLAGTALPAGRALRPTPTSPAPVPLEAAGPPQPAPAPAAPAPGSANPLLPGSVAFTVEALRAAWPGIVAAVRGSRRFLGEALAACDPVAVAPPELTLALREPNPIFDEPLERGADTIAEAVAHAVGAPVRVRMGPPLGAASAPADRRITDASVRADRLRELRSRDAALDAAANELDLEIVE